MSGYQMQNWYSIRTSANPDGPNIFWFDSVQSFTRVTSCKDASMAWLWG
jgi:hypothetical protein